MAYFYIIQDTSTLQYYAGVRTAIGCDPSELLEKSGYFTSSKVVSERLKAGTRFRVVKTVVREDAADYETRFLKRVRAASNERFLNITENGWVGGSPMHNPEIKEHVRQKRLATINSEEWKETVGKIAVEKMLASMDYSKAAEAQKKTKSSVDWKETVGKQARAAAAANTDYNRAAESQRKTKASSQWKETVGKEAVRKRMSKMDYKAVGRVQSNTKKSKEWLEANSWQCKGCGKAGVGKGNFNRYHKDKCYV